MTFASSGPRPGRPDRREEPTVEPLVAPPYISITARRARDAKTRDELVKAQLAKQNAAAAAKIARLRALRLAASAAKPT